MQIVMNIPSYFHLLTKTTVILKRILEIYYVKVNYEDNWLHEFISIFWNAGKIVQRIRIQNKSINFDPRVSFKEIHWGEIGRCGFIKTENLSF